MPPPAANVTGTASGQDGPEWSRDLVTLTFDLGGHGACGWCGLSSSIRIPSLKFVGLAVRKIWRTDVRVASKVGNLPSKFGHARPLGSRIIHYVRDGRTDERTDGQRDAYCPLPYGRGINGRGHKNSNSVYNVLLTTTPCVSATAGISQWWRRITLRKFTWFIVTLTSQNFTFKAKVQTKWRIYQTQKGHKVTKTHTLRLCGNTDHYTNKHSRSCKAICHRLKQESDHNWRTVNNRCPLK